MKQRTQGLKTKPRCWAVYGLRNSEASLARSEKEIAKLLDRIARLRAEGASQSAVSNRLGLSTGMAAGLVARARRNGDDRFQISYAAS